MYYYGALHQLRFKSRKKLTKKENLNTRAREWPNVRIFLLEALEKAEMYTLGPHTVRVDGKGRG